jgi:phosphoglycerate dehydrogenase-like enzyme
MLDDDIQRDTILITSWIEPELVERVRREVPGISVVYEPDLLRPPRYPADHTGHPVNRSPSEEARWRALLASASILFDFDPTHRDDLPELAPRVRWIQATSAGIGQLVRRMDYGRRMPNTVFTTASGVHARPLSEFVLLAMLAHVRGFLEMTRKQRARRWERFAGTDLQGRTVLVVGHGAIGSEVGRLARIFGMRVLGIKRRPDGIDPGSVHADELHGPGKLDDLLPRADFVVLASPHTDDTEGMIGTVQLSALRPGAALVNVGRGALVDEAALVSALESGHLGGAYLDVFAEEPLPEDNPLWTLPNVLVSPHSGSTSDRENARIVDLFCENLRRRREGHPLLNVLDLDRLY